MSESRRVIERLTHALAARSDSDLARRLGLRPSTVGSWRARETIPYAECVNLARRENISLDWLLDGVGPPRRIVAGEDTSGSDASGGLVAVPFYDGPWASAGGDAGTAVREPIAAYSARALPQASPASARTFRFPEHWLRQVVGVEPRHARALLADGYALRPEVDHGDLLILDTDLDRQRPNGLYVFLVDGQMQVKKLHFLPGRTVRVLNGTPAGQDYDIALERVAPADFAIVARVALHGRIL